MENQPLVIPQSPVAVQERVSRFFVKVYTWMAFGLALTGAVAAYVYGTPSILQAILGNSFNFYLIIIAELALVLTLSARIHKLSSTWAIGLFVAYAAVNGLTFSVIFLVYTMSSIAQVFFVTAGTFAAMSFYGYVTKTDLTRIGQLLTMALFGVIIGFVVNWFMRSPVLDYVISIIGVIVFVGLTAYDTQKLKHMAPGMQEGTEDFTKGAIIGALRLYLDFINLFLLLLRLFGRRR